MQKFLKSIRKRLEPMRIGVLILTKLVLGFVERKGVFILTMLALGFVQGWSIEGVGDFVVQVGACDLF